MAGTPTMLVWTWQKGRRFKTKGEAQAKLRVWKKWYERRGWRVLGNATSGYLAYSPDYDPSDATIWLRTEPHPTIHSAGVRPVDAGYLTTAEIEAKLSS